MIRLPLALRKVIRGLVNPSLSLLNILLEVILQANQEIMEAVVVEVEATEMRMERHLLIKPSPPQRKLLPVLPAPAVQVTHQVAEEVMTEKKLMIPIFPQVILNFHGDRTWLTSIVGFYV